MAIVDLRQRAGMLFLAVMVGHVLLISAQVTSKRGVSFLATAALGAFGEVERGIAATTTGIGRVWHGYVALRDARSENERLKGELDAARVEIQQQRALADRTRNLEHLLDLKDRVSLRTTAAEIIGAAATPDFRTITVNKGTSGGVYADMAVIAPAGVVGRVVVPTARTARVQLLLDRNAAAAAVIERSRAQGIIVGNDTRLLLQYVSEVSDVVVGDVVVTSGIDGIYPKGLVIGRVEGVEKSGTAYRRITVRQAVDAAALEEVLVVLAPAPEREAPGGGGE